MTHLSRMTLTLQKFGWRLITTTTITMCSVHCHHQLLGPQLCRDMICHLKRWILPHASSNACQLPIMNLRSIFGSLKKALTLETLLPGGLVAVLGFLVSPVLLVMCSEFQVLHILSHYRLTFNFLLDLPGSAVAVEHIFLGGCDSKEHTLNLTPYALSWLSNSTSDLLKMQSQM